LRRCRYREITLILEDLKRVRKLKKEEKMKRNIYYQLFDGERSIGPTLNLWRQMDRDSLMYKKNCRIHNILNILKDEEEKYIKGYENSVIVTSSEPVGKKSILKVKHEKRRGGTKKKKKSDIYGTQKFGRFRRYR